MSDPAALAALALSAFTSATLLPGTSEAALVGVLALDQAGLWAAIGVATVANVAGSTVNWGVGRFLERFRSNPRFPVSPARWEKTEASYRRWGVLSLLLSWTPIVGDPLTVVAGAMRTPLLVFLPLVTLAKGLRYVAVGGIAAGLF